MKPNGKNICAALKQVRKRVADTNGIVYAPKECHFEGDCNGTAPHARPKCATWNINSTCCERQERQ